jgi:DNA mismatch repair protein MutS2
MDLETLELIEFDQVLEIVAGFAQNSLGWRRVKQIEPLDDFGLVKSRLETLSEAVRYLELSAKIDLGHLPDPEAVEAVLENRDSVLSPNELLEVLVFLEFGQSAKRDLNPRKWPRLSGIVTELVIPFGLRSSIKTSIDLKGDVLDSAHPDLGSVRRKHEQFRAKARDQLNRYLKGAHSKHLIPEPYVTERGGRFVIPVRRESQNEIPGFVHGTSSSGATVFLEPLTAVELNNQQIFYRERETEIISRVLWDLTQQVRESGTLIREIIDSAASLDGLFACAEFGGRHDCVIPKLNQENMLFLKEARHPLLTQSLGEAKVVPVDLELDSESNTMVISGPNTGGKTACLKTAGLFCAMAHAGLPVPAREANLPLLRNTLADIGDHQSILLRLSTFSAHIGRIKEIMDSYQTPSLVLLDEVGRGTDPIYGSALAVAIIDHFRNRQGLVLATTHHRNVKSFAASANGVKNASVKLDPDSLQPTYQIETGVSGGSSGLEIAQQLGLSESIISRARELLDETDIQIEHYLEGLTREYQHLKKQQRELDDQLVRFKAQERELNAKAEKRERDRDQEFERKLEKWGNEFKIQISEYLKKCTDRDHRKRMKAEVQRRQAALKEAFRRKARLEARTEREVDAEPVAISKGDTVYHSLFKQRGIVTSVKGQEAVLEIDGKMIHAPIGQLQKIEKRQVDRQTAHQITISVIEDTDPELNLIGHTVDEALEALDKFLDRAFVSRLKEIRIIHGFGTGKLKASVAEALQAHPLVEEFDVEGGATKATLKN